VLVSMATLVPLIGDAVVIATRPVVVLIVAENGRKKKWQRVHTHALVFFILNTLKTLR
jgi:hypothetical protein